MLINPILVGLQLMFLINNFELFVNKVKMIKGAAEDGSPGILRLNPNKFFCPFSDIK